MSGSTSNFISKNQCVVFNATRTANRTKLTSPQCVRWQRRTGGYRPDVGNGIACACIPARGDTEKSDWFLGASAKLRKATLSLVTSVRLHGTTRLPLDGFSRNLISEYSSKICRENSSFTTIWEELQVLYMKTNIHFWSYFTHFFLECCFRCKLRRNSKPIFYVQ